MRIRYQTLSITILLFSLFIVACGNGGSDYPPPPNTVTISDSVTVPPTTTATSPPQLVIKVFLSNSSDSSASAKLPIHVLGKFHKYIVTILIQAIDATTGIKTIEVLVSSEKTSCNSNSPCQTEHADGAWQKIYLDPNAKSGSEARKQVITDYNLDLVRETAGYKRAEFDISVATTNAHNQRASHRGIVITWSLTG